MTAQFFGQPTTCGNSHHRHDLPTDADYLGPKTTIAAASTPVHVSQSSDGRLVRYVGSINYEPVTGRIHVVPRTGITPVELQALMDTALHPHRDYMPGTWPQHPCVADRRRISLARFVDDDYTAEAATLMFGNLQLEEARDVIQEWSQGLVLA